MKKWLSVLLCLALICFSGCSEKAEENPVSQNDSSAPVVVQEPADEEPEIVSSVETYLSEQWDGEFSVQPSDQKIEVVLSASGEIPDFLDATQTIATKVSDLVADDQEVSRSILMVKSGLDSSATIYLTFIDGKLSFRADEAQEIDSTPHSVIPVRNTAIETLSQKNAVEKAISYISLMPFSYEGLVEQLEYEKFSSEDAAYGATYCGADWYEQAVLAAENYLDLIPFSHDGLVEQLEYDGFTHEQAVHGVEENGLY